MKPSFIVVSELRGPANKPASHEDLISASREAARLAKTFPEDRFIVFEAVRRFSVRQVVVDVYPGHLDREDGDIPF